MPDYEEYIEAIRPLWESHWLTNMGRYHRVPEEKLRDFLQVPYLSLMVNGHMSLELALQSLKLPAGSEVITTPFTFISTTHAIVRNKLKPVFCDVKEEDGTIDVSKIEELITEHTSAIMPVHVYGNICDVEKIQEIAYKYYLKVIYDAAPAFGETYKGRGIIFEAAFPFSRNEMYERLVKNKIFARKYFYPLTCDQACFRNRHMNDLLPMARHLSESVLTLPLYEELGLDDVDYICSLISSAYNGEHID